MFLRKLQNICESFTYEGIVIRKLIKFLNFDYDIIGTVGGPESHALATFSDNPRILRQRTGNTDK